MIDTKRFVTLLRLGEDVEPQMQFAHKQAQMLLQHASSVPSDIECADCCNQVSDHMDFVPELTHMRQFLMLHPHVKALVMSYSAADTEARSALMHAVTQFTLRIQSFVEDPAVNELAAVQWKFIWNQ